MVSTYTSYEAVMNNLARFQATTNTGMVQNETNYYKANIGKVKSVSDLVNNPRLFNYVMTSFGLGSMTYAKALVTKVLQQGVSSKTALANTLNDPRYIALATTFDFADKGAKTTQSSAVTTDVVNQYIEQNLETNQGKSNPGVQLALYFSRHASTITNSYDILADKSLLSVVQTALGIPAAMSSQDVDTQATYLTNALNQGGMKMSDFKDSTKVLKFVERFTIMYDVQQSKANLPDPALAVLEGSSSSATDIGNTIASILAGSNSSSNASLTPSILFTSASQSTGLSQNLLEAIANLNTGG